MGFRVPVCYWIGRNAGGTPHREYESLSDFIGSSHADSEAYCLYRDGDY
ncbi:hypothetical protein [Bacillus mycoides]|nr:hypothetical protein [Bacillus mycoides]